jgi:hypothetical protein
MILRVVDLALTSGPKGSLQLASARSIYPTLTLRLPRTHYLSAKQQTLHSDLTKPRLLLEPVKAAFGEVCGEHCFATRRV